MTRFTTSLRNLLMVAVLGLMSIGMMACSNDDSDNNSMGPQTHPEAHALAGVYESNYRWGGASGLWRSAIELTVNSDGTVFYGQTEIINPTFGPNSLAWTMADGNKNQAAVTFKDSDDNAYFWADKGKVTARNFSGWLQNPGEGKLDFRGLIK